MKNFSLIASLSFRLSGLWNQNFVDDFRKFSEPLVFLFTMIGGAILLFLGRMLDIHVLYFSVVFQSSRPDTLQGTFEREGGQLLALNWIGFFIFLMPVLIALFSGIIADAHRLLASFSYKRMILYRRIDDEQDHPASSNSLWLDVSQKASKLIMVFFILGFFFGALQWYQYSGQWYLFGYNREEFLQVSTGIDWNIAWVADNRTGINGFITFAYILICWLYYSIGWCFIFAMYGLLFKVIDRIQEMTNSGVFKGQAAIVADKEDEQYAGFRNLIR